MKLVFSGDIGNKEQPIFNHPSHIDQADYVIMESTYGIRLHLTKEIDPAYQDEVLLRLAELEHFVDQGIKKTAG